MFCVGGGARYPETFRLQLFTPGARPVAVAIQAMNEGASLVNGRERYLADVWRRHCPDQPQPPALNPAAAPARRGRLRPARDDSRHQPGRRALRRLRKAASTDWLTLEDIRRLVDADVAPDRAAGYVPRPPEPYVPDRFTVVRVALFPAARPVPRGRPHTRRHSPAPARGAPTRALQVRQTLQE
ncbi:hypothetical protein [Actinomadura coerulea]|uniref:hypothetical protein n=1 Tax=Actinomadura coerulea TaxID=46159 RepID=UPI00344852AB